jgi:cell division protein FtsA
MAREDIIVGLEIGTSKVCAVVGETKQDGTIKILGVGQAPSRGVRKGEIVDFDTAGKCVREALADAEEKSDVMIRSVFLAVTGSHVASFNNRGSVNIPEDREEICEEDFEDVQAAAREVSIPQPNMFLHSILQHYYVDGQDGVLNPMGMIGSRLEADFHIIHGVGNRIKNSVRCVKELDIEVEDVVFSPLASAQVVLDLNQKNLGGLMIDIGGGTTGYVVYADGAVRQSGVLAVGGDHITNDISLGLRIPMAKAERIKIEEGCVTLGAGIPGEMVVLKDETGFAGKELERETLNNIIHSRVREIFELLKRRLDQSNNLDYLGAGLLLTAGAAC